MQYDNQLLAKMWNDNVPSPEIAKHFGQSVSSVSRHVSGLRRMGVDVSWRMKKRPRYNDLPKLVLVLAKKKPEGFDFWDVQLAAGTQADLDVSKSRCQEVIQSLVRKGVLQKLGTNKDSKYGSALYGFAE